VTQLWRLPFGSIGAVGEIGLVGAVGPDYCRKLARWTIRSYLADRTCSMYGNWVLAGISDEAQQLRTTAPVSCRAFTADFNKMVTKILALSALLIQRLPIYALSTQRSGASEHAAQESACQLGLPKGSPRRLRPIEGWPYTQVDCLDVDLRKPGMCGLADSGFCLFSGVALRGFQDRACCLFGGGGGGGLGEEFLIS